MTQDSPQVQAIRARFKNSFAEKKQLIDQHQLNIQDVESQEGMSLKDVFELAHTDLHKLAGSFGMYGYSDVALICRSAMKATANEDVAESLTLLTQLSNELSGYLK